MRATRTRDRGVDASGSVHANAAARPAVTIDTIDRSKRGFKPPSIVNRDDEGVIDAGAATNTRVCGTREGRDFGTRRRLAPTPLPHARSRRVDEMAPAGGGVGSVDLRSVVCLDDLERHARLVMDAQDFDYFAGGAETETTLRANASAFARVTLWPRCLVDVSRVTTETAPMPSVGVHAPLAAPILVAPVAMQRMAHPDGEIGAALACAEARVPYCASQQSTTRVERIGEAIAKASGATMWFQLYVLRDRAAVEALVRRAERAGATALVVTVDAPTLGRRERDVRNKFALAAGLRLANVDAEVPESKSKSKSKSKSESGSSAPSSSAQASISRRIGGRDDSLTWRDVRWLRSITSLPVILKGVLTPEDARDAVASGAAAVWVSNHGGRQLDGAPATLEALPGVARGVSGRVPIIFDGGVRRGADALKAIALGADLVAVGRPAAFGLACAGRAGVEAALGMLAEELRTAMALAGVRDVEEAKDRRLVATPADRWGEFGGGGARGDERVSALRRWKSPGTRGKAPRAKM